MGIVSPTLLIERVPKVELNEQTRKEVAGSSPVGGFNVLSVTVKSSGVHLETSLGVR